MSVLRDPLPGRWEGGPSIKLTLDGNYNYGPAWSPDGRSVTFSSTLATGATDLWTKRVDGGAQAVMQLHEKWNLYNPRWSPDGKWISFSPNRGFSSGIFIVHPDGTALRRLTENDGWAVWWPDSQQIGFQAIGPDGNTQIQVFTLKSGELRTLPGFHFIGDNFPFDISRDAKWITATNYQHISDEVWLLEPNR